MWQTDLAPLAFIPKRSELHAFEVLFEAYEDERKKLGRALNLLHFGAAMGEAPSEAERARLEGHNAAIDAIERAQAGHSIVSNHEWMSTQRRTEVASDLDRLERLALRSRGVDPGDGSAASAPQAVLPAAATTAEPAAERIAQEEGTAATVESDCALPAKRRRAPVFSDVQFRRRLDDAGRRIVTGDTSGLASSAEHKLIQKNRRLTKRAVMGMMGVGKTAFDEYLGPERCTIDWEAWKVDIEQRYRSR